MKLTSSLILIFLFSFIISENALGMPDDKLALDIYKVDLSQTDSYSKLEKGTNLNLILLDDISNRNQNTQNSLNLEVQDNNFKATASGLISRSRTGERLSMFSELELVANKLYLEDGQEINFSSSSPLLTSTHSPHANSSTLALARTLTSLSIGTSPLTLGTGLGISFLVNGIISAHQNGIKDFFWGGFNGSGLSFIERIFRKQPDIFLSKGTLIPFTLRDDLKINNGIKKEKTEYLKLSKEEAINKIEQMLNRGDLAGALELVVKTGNIEMYDEIMNKISL